MDHTQSKKGFYALVVFTSIVILGLSGLAAYGFYSNQQKQQAYDSKVREFETTIKTKDTKIKELEASSKKKDSEIERLQKDVTPGSTTPSQDKLQQIKAKVAKQVAVPADETPTLATVTDPAKLKDQPFFKDAKTGDYILIFPQAKKAYIYRESENKIINSGPIAITGP